jgi:hypothetical protein
MYHNFSQPKGLCLLFNNRDFVTMPHRAGTDVDAANMVRLFTQLGYNVKRKDNLSADVRVCVYIFIHMSDCLSD